MSAQRRKFTAEFRQEAVALVQRSGQSANQVAKELGISQTALSRWLREVRLHAGSPNGFQAANELRALRREVERLRMERDILKKGGSLLRHRVAMRYSFIQAGEGTVSGCGVVPGDDGHAQWVLCLVSAPAEPTSAGESGGAGSDSAMSP